MIVKRQQNRVSDHTWMRNRQLIVMDDARGQVYVDGLKEVTVTDAGENILPFKLIIVREKFL